MAVITDLDNETLQREDTEMVLIIITLIREAMFGMIIALMAVSLVLFIDHAFVLRLPIASNFRRATFHVMNNQETLRDLENNAGLKFMEMDEYTVMLNETEQAFSKTKFGGKILRTRSDDLVKMQKDLSETLHSHPKLMASLGLDKFCSDCLWNESEGVTCEKRVEALVTANKTPKYEAMLSTMKTPSCRIVTEAEIAEQKRKVAEAEEQKRQEAEIKEFKKRAQAEEQKRRAELEERKWQKAAESEEQKRQAEIEEKKRQRAEDNELPREKIVNLKDFCPGCKWSASMTCIERATYSKNKYGIPMDGAIANAMKKKSCKIPEDMGNWEKVHEVTSLDSFCPECFWSKRLEVTCKQRVKTIRADYGISKDQAMLSAMKKQSCKTKGLIAEVRRQNRQREDDITLDLLN